MAEIYRDSIGKAVAFSIPSASASVTSAKIIREGEETTVPTAIVGEETRAQIPYSITRYDGKFDIEYAFTVNGTGYTKRESHEVVTPLFSVAELRAADSDFSTIQPAQIEHLERIIRSLFETLTGQSYGLENGTVAITGGGQQSLLLPKRSAEPLGPEFGDGPYRAQVGSDGWRIHSYLNESWIDKFEPDRLLGLPRTFAQGQTFYFKGLWGYYSVPEDINLAAITLAQDYGCEQSIWRDRYLKSVRMADMRYDMDGRAFIKTGNVKVDQILDRYARVRMVVL